MPLKGLLDGDRRSLARALTQVEDRTPGFRDLLRGLSPATGRAHRVGITGAPGVGKSSLVSALIREARARGLKVAVLAVDPTSPFTGGALLGDRVRMTDHLGDPGVFVRSMASRGALGGLSVATGDALDVMDAAGFDLLLLETVGAGQVDVDVARESETTLVLFAPGAGDGIQAMKSGLMEVADLWVVNKCDDPRASRVRADILASLNLHDPPPDLEERVVMVSALEGTGVVALLDQLEERLRAMEKSGARESARGGRLLGRVATAARERVASVLEAGSERTEALLARIRAGAASVHDVADEILQEAARDSGRSPS